MQDLGVSDVKVFEDWLEEEKVYLLGLQKEPLEETLQMEYFQKLLNLQASKCVSLYSIFVLRANIPLSGTPSRLQRMYGQP